MKKLLFIEDEIITGSIYKHHFTNAGYTVRWAANGEEGLAALAEFRPDIVVLDLMLPRIDGLEILRHIRTGATTKTLPVIVFANAYSRQLIIGAEKGGADKCLIKSKTRPAELLAAVRASLAFATPTPERPGETEFVQLTSGAPAAAPPDPRAEFFQSTPQVLATLKSVSQNLLKTAQEAGRPALVLELYRAVHALPARAALAKAPRFAQMASVLEALLKDLDDKPHKINASTMRTVNQSIEFLGVLLTDTSSHVEEEMTEFKILVVDDEALSRKAVADALERAYLKPVVMEDPIAALGLLVKQRFNLVVTDVNMPGMGGFELCAKLRALPANTATPVIFVTALNGFEARVRSAQSGGDDFIAKPFLYLELAVKALNLILRGQLKTGPSGFHTSSNKSA